MKQIFKHGALFTVSVMVTFLVKTELGSAANYVVTSTADSGVGTLRQAITDANNNPGVDDITFAIPGSSLHAITLSSPLPDITETVHLDGTSQNGTVCDGSNTVIKVAVNFNGLNHGIEVAATAPGTVVSGLALYGARSFNTGLGRNGWALRIAGNNSVVRCNFFGTTDGATVASSSGDGWSNDGAWIWQADGVRIGGPNASDFNLFTGDSGAGIGGTGPTNVLIEGNYIGVNKAGTAKLGSVGIGVSLLYGVQTGNVIKNNLISGAESNGIEVRYLENGSEELTIIGNRIGTDAVGSSAIANGENGVEISGITRSTKIGGILTTDRNVIAGNAHTGIFLAGSTAGTIQNNYIGTSATGTTLLSNGRQGVDIQTTGESWNIDSNVINRGSATSYSAVSISGGRNHIIRNNRIGVDHTATTALSSFNAAVATTSNEPGGMVIESNIFGALSAGDGFVYILNGSGHRIRGNYFGTNATGSALFPGAPNGVKIASSLAKDVVVGGVSSVDKNVFEGITWAVSTSATDTSILGNVLRNSQYPIWFTGARTPEITSFNAAGPSTEVTVRLDTAFPSGEYRIELFSNGAYANAAGGIDAEDLVGITSVVKSSAGVEEFTVTIPGDTHTFPSVTATQVDTSSDGFGRTSMVGRYTIVPSSDLATAITIDSSNRFTVRTENLGPTSVAGSYENYITFLFWVPPGLDYVGNSLSSDFSCMPYGIPPYDTSGTLVYCLSLSALLEVGESMSFDVFVERNNEYNPNNFFKVAAFSSTDPDQAAILAATGTGSDFFGLVNNSIALYQGADEGGEQEQPPAGPVELPEAPAEEAVQRGEEIMAAAQSATLGSTGSSWHRIIVGVFVLQACSLIALFFRKKLLR